MGKSHVAKLDEILMGGGTKQVDDLAEKLRKKDVSVAEVRQVIADAKKETHTSRADVNALKVLRWQLRHSVKTAYQKLEPRIRDAIRDRADMGHVQVQVTVDLRPAE